MNDKKERKKAKTERQSMTINQTILITSLEQLHFDTQQRLLEFSFLFPIQIDDAILVDLDFHSN